MKGNLGTGFARVTVEITRPNGDVDRAVFHKIVLAADEDSEFELFEEDPVDLFPKDQVVAKAPDMYLGLKLAGRMLGNPSGVQYTYETGVKK